jgi:hypothetical protein
VGFLRRLLGGDGGADGDRSPAAASPPKQEQLDEEERAHELELAKFEQSRTTDLMRRQQRYTDKSWTPPAQGGTVRAGESEEDGGEEASERQGSGR